MSGRLPVYIIPAGKDLIDGRCILNFILKFNIHFITNGHGVGRGDPVDFKDPFHTGIICSPGLIFDRVPASGGFVNECLHKIEPDYQLVKPAMQRFGGKIATN